MNRKIEIKKFIKDIKGFKSEDETNPNQDYKLIISEHDDNVFKLRKLKQDSSLKIKVNTDVLYNKKVITNLNGFYQTMPKQKNKIIIDEKSKFDPRYKIRNQDQNDIIQSDLNMALPNIKQKEIYFQESKLGKSIDADMKSNEAAGSAKINMHLSSNMENLYKPKNNLSSPQELLQRMQSQDMKKVQQKFYESWNKEKEPNNMSDVISCELPKFPLDVAINTEISRPDFIYDLEMVSNLNQKEIIKVSHPPGKLSHINVKNIPNPIDYASRDKYFGQINFITDYKSGYTPIQVQDQQEKEFSYKNHFIRQKQTSSNINLKRCCGVSYAKKSESTQANVDHIFAKLPPLIFQGSTGCIKIESCDKMIKQVFQNIFSIEDIENAYILATFLEASDDNIIREYLLCPEKRFEIAQGKVWLLKSINDIWYFMKDKYFVCIHLVYDDALLLRRPNLKKFNKHEIIYALAQSNVQIGLLFKKSTSGKKAFLKSFAPDYMELDLDVLSDKEDNLVEETKKPEEGELNLSTKNAPTKKGKTQKALKDNEADSKSPEKKKKSSKKQANQQDSNVNLNLNIQRSQSNSEFSEDNPKNHEKEEFLSQIKSKLSQISFFNPTIMDNVIGQVSKIFEPYLNILFDSGRSIHSIESTTPNTPSMTPTPSMPVTWENSMSGNEQTQQESVKDQKKTISLDLEENPTATKESTIKELIEEYLKDKSKTIITLSTRLELYTSENSWKSASFHTKNLLYSFIIHVNQVFEEKLRLWTKFRYDIAKSKDYSAYLESPCKNIKLLEFSPDYDEVSIKYLINNGKNNLNWNFDETLKQINEGILDLDHDQKNIIIPTTNTTLNQDANKVQESMIIPELQEKKPICFSNFQENTKFAKESLLLPLYLISTRDSFAYDLIEKVTVVNMRGNKVLKKEYFFDPAAYPSNFKSFLTQFPDYRVGVVTYDNFFTNEELKEIENQTYDTERKCFSNHYLPMTGQMTCTSEKVRRTKFFFGARYMWSAQQLSEPHSMVGAGVRIDVSSPPKWMRELIEKPMVQSGIVEKDFINSITMNVYHDGKEGLAQHFDDAVRFKQPIFTLRIFSDSRLSFGSQFYGFCNGAFCIPLKRGCITALEEGSYAANGIKHCVRPADMTGKSAAIILRQMHGRVVKESQIYNEYVDFPAWFSTLSVKDDAVSYADQKRLEAEEILKCGKKVKSQNNNN